MVLNNKSLNPQKTDGQILFNGFLCLQWAIIRLRPTYAIWGSVKSSRPDFPTFIYPGLHLKVRLFSSRVVVGLAGSIPIDPTATRALSPAWYSASSAARGHLSAEDSHPAFESHRAAPINCANSALVSNDCQPAPRQHQQQGGALGEEVAVALRKWTASRAGPLECGSWLPL
jgi:hypothetical protein